MPNDMKIVQMMAADGWYAVFLVNYAPHFKLERLISFVLIEEKDGRTTVDGLGSSLNLCLGSGMEMDSENHWQSPHFSEFLYETEITEELKAQWADRAKELFPNRGAGGG
jgi:hypothetical protein